MRARLTVLLLFMVVAAARLAGAQETTEAERLYLEARRSDDRATQLLGERWHGLVKLQEWNDESGKFSISAKYVEHDPDLKWVKLRAVKGSGEQRVVKDLTIPLDKLDKRSQSRVRQIAKVQGMVAESLASTAQPKEEGADQQLDRGLADARNNLRAEPELEPLMDPTMDPTMEAPADQPRVSRAAAAGEPPVEPAAEAPTDPRAARPTDPHAAAAQPPEVPNLEALALQVIAMQIGIEITNPTSPLGIPSAIGASPSD